MVTNPNFKREAEAIFDELVATRRDFHRHPEIGFQEQRTARIVAQRLQSLGLEVQTGVGQTGVVGLLEGSQPGPTVLLRFDMDALPIHEQNQVEYASQNPGVMHACGHDGHTSMGLGVARIMSQYQDQIVWHTKICLPTSRRRFGRGLRHDRRQCVGKSTPRRGPRHAPLEHGSSG